MTPRGEVLAYAKLASRPLAVSSLDNERRILEKLATVPALRRQVPQVLLWRYQSETAALLLTAGPDKPGPQRLTTAHQDFLRTLHEAFREQRLFSASAMWRGMKHLYVELSPSLSGEWRDRYERALALLERELGGTTVSLTLAHRDFTPWNTRQRRDGTLFVFDWEFAATGYLAGYDACHFRFMAHLLLKRRTGRIDYIDKDPDGQAKANRLAHLIDLGLFYHQALFARAGTEDDAVLRHVAKYLDQAVA